jgi:hypothetical protein
MGFTNDGGVGSGKFANFKDGKIVTKIDGEKMTFNALEGTIVAIYIEDDNYDNKDYRKVNCRIEHEDGVTILGFPLSSGYGKAFCCLLPNVDPTKPVKISGGIQKDKVNPKIKYASMFIEQDKKSVKWYYSKETKRLLPEVVEETIGSGKNAKVVKDYSKREDFFERLITKFDEKLQKIYGKKDKVKAPPKTADEVTEPIDDLPF